MFWKKPKTTIYPEWLIVGLGNPGAEFAGTRHNVGFDAVELLAKSHRIKLDKTKHKSRIGLGAIGTAPVCLVRPLTFMNLSGQSVAPLARDYGIKPEKILVIADDLDLPVGKVRLRLNGSAGGHNGHKSLIQYLKTQDYPRIKIGIGKAIRGETIDHVLSGFPPAERAEVDRAIETAARTAEAMVERGANEAQLVVGEYNKAPDPGD